MAERTERTALNALTVSCRDAEQGFTWAAEHAKDAKLKTLFSDLAKQRRQYADDLLPHAQRLGGDAASDGSRWASLHRAWMAVKDRVVTDHDQAIVAEAIRGEHSALAAYADALNGMLPPDALEMIETQEKGIKAALDQLQLLTTPTT